MQVWIQGAFPEGTAEAARQMITELLAPIKMAVPDVRVRLSANRDPAVHFPVVAQANVDLAGRPIRAQVNAATAREAITALRDRLRYQLDRVQHGVDQLGSCPRPPVNPRVAPFPRRPETRQIVRYKPWPLALLAVDDAVWEMELRDYGFHLFTEIGSGQDSVVYHAGPTSYRLTQLLPSPDRLARYTVTLSWYDRPAPTLSPAEAAQRLGWSEAPFLFFRHVDSGRGSVLYRRYDGHYGLLCPPCDNADSPSDSS